MTKAKNVKKIRETNGLPPPRGSLGVEESNAGRGSPSLMPNESLQLSSQPTQPSQPTEETPSETIQLSELEFRDLLKRLSESAGCMAELARRLSVSGQWIGDICAGRKKPGPKLLAALGATSEIVYRIPISRGEEVS